MSTILITSTEITSNDWKSPRSGEVVKFHRQVAYLKGVSEFPQEFQLSLETPTPYPAGEYELAPDSIVIYNRNLQLKRNLKLIPVPAKK